MSCVTCNFLTQVVVPAAKTYSLFGDIKFATQSDCWVCVWELMFGLHRHSPFFYIRVDNNLFGLNFGVWQIGLDQAEQAYVKLLVLTTRRQSSLSIGFF